MKKNIFKIFIIFIFIMVLICPIISNSIFILLGDMDNDGMITNQDSSILKSYLLDKENLNENQSKIADMNQDSKISITDYAIVKSIILGLTEPPILQETVYDVELEKFDIKNNGVVWNNNAIGMTNAIHYAKENGYQEVRFPTGVYTIQAPTPIIIDTKDLIINFNESTIKMQDAPHSAHWCMIDVRDPAENLVIKNGTIQGNRFSEQFDSTNPYNEGAIPFSIKAGNHITIENLIIKDSTGYGMTMDTGMNRTKKVEIWANDFESGSISNQGVPEKNTNTLRSKKMYCVEGLGEEFEIGYTAGYQGYGSILHQEYTAYFYDKHKNFISMSSEKQYVKSSLPKGCQYLKIVIPQTQIKDGSEGSAFITNAKTFRNSIIKNCTFDANSAVGLAIGGGQNFMIEDCTFTRNGITIDNRPSISAKVAIDIEDGWECMQNITLRRNTFLNNRYDLTSCAGNHLLLEENTFTNGCNISARSTNYIVTKNQFQGPVEFGVSMGGNVSDNTYTDCSIHIFYQKFGHDPQTPILNIHDESFYNTSVYAQNIDSQKQNQLVKNSTFKTSDGKKIWLLGNYENCTFTQADFYNSAILTNCKIQNSNIYSQSSSQYHNCQLKNGNIITNSADEILICNSQVTNVPIEITTWAKSCKLEIVNSTLTSTDSSKSILRLSAGKAKEINLTKNKIYSAKNVIEFFDTTYSPPQGNLSLVENTIFLPKDSYVIYGNKIESGNYQIECRKNVLNEGHLFNPTYQDSEHLKIVVEEPDKSIPSSSEITSINHTSYQSIQSNPKLSTISYTENTIPSFSTILETTSNSIFHENDEFEIMLKLKNYNAIENGLFALIGQLHYDKDVLEIISMEGGNGWIFDTYSFNENNGKFLLDSNQYLSQEESILKIKFKVKPFSKLLNETIIEINPIIASNGMTDITSNATNLTITLLSDDDNTPTPPDDKNQINNSKNENINSSNSTNFIISKNKINSIDNSSATKPIPFAGSKNIVLIFLVIAILVCVMYYTRLKYLNY